MSSIERISTLFSKETLTYNTKTNKFELKKFIVFKNKEKKLNKWKMNMLLHFYCFSHLFLNEKRKVLYTLFYTKESALTWTQHRVSDFLQNTVNERENETNQIFHDFENLTTVLKETFETENSKQAAEIKIQRFKQTESVEKYAVDFKTLIYQLSWTNKSMLLFLYYTELKNKVKNIILQQEISNQLENMMILSIKIDNRQYQRYLKRKENAVYAFRKKTDYKDSIKINVTEERTEKRCYTCGKKRHLKRNCEKTREEICVIDETEWEDLADDRSKDDWFKSHIESTDDSETQDNDEESSKMKFAELESRFPWTFLEAARSLLTTIRINILEMRSTTLITTDEDSYQITKELMFKASERVLHLDNVIINLINRYENVHLHLRYSAERQKKMTTFEVLDDLRCYVILDASDQNKILKENLTDEDIASQSSI